MGLQGSEKLVENRTEETQELEKSLFGNNGNLIVHDRTTEHTNSDRAGRKKRNVTGQQVSKPAWRDPDDQELWVDLTERVRSRKLQKKPNEDVISGSKYVQRLRDQHRKLKGRPSWAEPGGGGGEDGSGDEDDEGSAAVLRKAGSLLASSSRSLPPGVIDVSRCKDANAHGQTQGVVRSVGFHSNGQLFMTAGLDKKLRLFQVDGVRNPPVQTVFLEDCPVHTAAFSGDGNHIVATGRRPFYYVYDLGAGKVDRMLGVMGHEDKSWESFTLSPSQDNPMIAFLGKHGTIPLVSLKSRQPVGSLKMPGDVRCAAFTHDGWELIAGGTDGKVFLFDIRMQSCVGCQVDDGCINGSALAVSGDGRRFASGSDTGVVNVYSWDGLRRGAEADSLPGAAVVKPEKALMNLTMVINSLAFSSDGSVLAMASRMKKGALRLIHAASGRVYANWPTQKSGLHYVNCLAFSPGGGYLAVGNAQGKALLYRLHHFGEA